MSRPVVRWPLCPSAANGSGRGSLGARCRCLAIASRAIADADVERRRASRVSASAKSSGNDSVVRVIRAYYQAPAHPVRGDGDHAAHYLVRQPARGAV